MSRASTTAIALAIAALAAGCTTSAQKPQSPMTFFVTSTGSGNGANFGGLAGADRHCQKLAEAVGAGDRQWRAYLSTQGAGAVNARDRIGTGPWRNVKGVVIASSIAELHGQNNLNKETGLTEKGETIPGSGEQPTRHDILTGSTPEGTAFPAGEDMTCRNWTSGTDGAAMLGHFDRRGTNAPPNNSSWNSSHKSAGCDDPALIKTGGAGYLYCFAAK